MIKLYRYGYVNSRKIQEIEAEGETKTFWIIKGRRRAKRNRYPDSIWYRTPQEAIRAYIELNTNKRDNYLRWAKERQNNIDEASGFLLGLKED